MNLVAATDFRNPRPVSQGGSQGIEIENALHELHIHKGARFNIGGDLPLDKMSAADKRLVAELNAAGRIVDEDHQPELVKQIDEEVDRAESLEAKKLAESKKALAPKSA